MARDFFPGIGQAVAERTILRKIGKRERWETWLEVAERVAEGNAMICQTAKEKTQEYRKLKDHISNGRLLTSGRHLQHGDLTQRNRNMEVFTNCSTSITTFGLVYLLLNGSGVGRCYDDDLMMVDWDNAPNVLCVLDSSHPDFDYTAHETVRDAKHKYGENVIWHSVGDSREEWGGAVELLELLAFERIHKDKLLILDFSKVRCKGRPIGGMQNRPASGPVPLMNAFQRVNSLKGAGMEPWMQAMYIDHYFAECVLVGGVRRSARMAVKYWKDASIFKFIEIKRPIEFWGLSGPNVLKLRQQRTEPLSSFLWSSNNSVGVDSEFWELLRLKKRNPRYKSELAKHARKVFEKVTECAYYDGTGEPGIINLDALVRNDSNLKNITGSYFESNRYKLQDGTLLYLDRLLKIAKSKQFYMIINPCAEIALALWGAFCVSYNTRIAHRHGYDKIGDLVGTEIEVWNGEEWSKVRPYQTGTNQKLVRIEFSDGSDLECTEYHQFSIRGSRQGSKYHRKRAIDLKEGDILPTFRLDEDIEGDTLQDAYTYGVFLGDGSIEHRTDRPGSTRYDIDLYAEKRHLPVVGTKGTWNGKKCTVTVGFLKHQYLRDLKAEGLPDWVFQLDRESTLEFIRGWLDTDGCLNEDGGFTVTSIDYEKCLGLQLLLRRIGVSYATVGISAVAGTTTNFGVRENTLYKVYIPNSESGIVNGYRVKTDRQINLERMVKQQRVISVEPIEGRHDTFCFTEPKRGMGVFNNVLTYQCTIADTCLYHCDTFEQCEDVVRAAVRALIRVNTLDSVYNKEVKRTNRIGIGLTGIHEFAQKFYGYNFLDLIDEQKSLDFWMFLSFLKRAIRDEAITYSKLLGVEPPHTDTTVKPSGTISKLFGLTEGWHLAAMAQYLRWVQFSENDPLVKEYEAKGYPTRKLEKYKGTIIVGFPTEPLIASIQPPDRLVTASQATMEQQYTWLMLGEKYWIRGVDEEGNPLPYNTGNQISYTLKYDPKVVSIEEFREMFLKYQSQVRCCSVMPTEDGASYEYLPEEPVPQAVYNDIVRKIKVTMKEDVGREHLDCPGGACPVDFKQ